MSEASQPYQTSLLAACCSRITDGSHFSPTPQEAGLPIANVKDMRDGYIDLDACTKISRAEFDLLAANNCVISSGMVLLSKDGTVGKVIAYRQPERIAALSSIALISPFETVNGNYLAHALSSHAAKRQYENFMSGSALRRLVLRDIRQIVVQIPDFAVQAKIAEVLDTLDAAIRGTEAVVAKLRAMKQGLLHDLLTRGVDANGDLRPPQPEAPHLYHQTPLGWLPKEWEVREVQDLLAPVDPAMRSGPFGSALLKEELVSQGIPFLGIDNVHVERFDRDYKRFVTPSKFQQLRRYSVRPNDLMITIMGTVGRCCLVPHDVGEALSSKHTWTISLDQAKYSPYLAMLQVNYCDWVLRHFSKDQQGGTMSAIRSETIRSTLLPVPPLSEQASIEAILTELASRLRDELSLLDKLRLQKSGLMDDLLTGRVPVTPLL